MIGLIVDEFEAVPGDVEIREKIKIDPRLTSKNSATVRAYLSLISMLLNLASLDYVCVPRKSLE